MHLALVLVAVAANLYGMAYVVRITDLGRNVDLVERSVRRGEGDHDLSKALASDTSGEWD